MRWFRLLTGTPPREYESTPVEHPLWQYLENVKEGLDNLNKIQEAVSEAHAFLSERKELERDLAATEKEEKPSEDEKGRMEEIRKNLNDMEAKANDIAVKLCKIGYNDDYCICEYGDNPLRGNLNGYVHEDLYEHMKDLFCSLRKNFFLGMENFDVENGKLKEHVDQQQF